MNNGVHYYEITVCNVWHMILAIASSTQVVVTDGGLLTNGTLVSINVTDVNDNPPYFDPFQYTDTFLENQPAQFRFDFQV